MIACNTRNMMRFLKRRGDGGAQGGELGHLETQVMELVWARGDGNVHDMMGWLDRPLAYTTVMTTLDRLYKKGLLERRKAERAFVYSPRISREEWERKRAGELVAGFLASPATPGELLVSCFVEAVGERNEALLDALERNIRKKRKELDRRAKA
jgi:predicted transcriptional regulator